MPQLHMAHGHCGKVKKNKKHNIQCPMPFVHYNIKLDPKSTACWRCHENLGDFTKHSLKEIWHGEKWQDFRKQHLRGERPKGCKSCWQMEDRGLASTRTEVLEEFESEIAEMETWSEEQLLRPDFPSDIEIRFGNLCNLQCRHCSPTYSSQWMKQLKQKDSYVVEARDFIDDISTHSSINSIPSHTASDLKEMAPGLTWIKVTGGEPLMHPSHYDMLDSFAGYEQNITLEYNTNLHYLGLKDQNVIDYWKRFKKVICRVSIDADPKGFEYVRSRGNLDTLLKNWQTVETEFADRIKDQTFDLHATCTINVLNVIRLPEIFEFFSSLGSKLHTSLVQYPNVMDICNLPEWQKAEIIADCERLIEQASDYTYSHWRYSDKTAKRYRDVVRFNIKSLRKVIGWLQRPSNTEFEKQFSWWMRTQDKMHGTNLIKDYPEFAYLEELYGQV